MTAAKSIAAMMRIGRTVHRVFQESWYAVRLVTGTEWLSRKLYEREQRKLKELIDRLEASR